MGQSYRDLIAWQKAMDFVMDVYRTSKAFPREEVYGLASQLRMRGGWDSHEYRRGAGAIFGQRISLFSGTGTRGAG